MYCSPTKSGADFCRKWLQMAGKCDKIVWFQWNTEMYPSGWRVRIRNRVECPLLRFQNALIFRAFRICCLRSAEELLHIFLRFAKRGGCEWGAILRVTSGTHKFSSNHYSKWLEIMWLVLKGEYLYMEAYRSGCNELHSKFRQKLGISSPRKPLLIPGFQKFKSNIF